MIPTTNEKTHKREHRSLLAAPEKRLLVWIAERLPTQVSSDHLSLLGLVSMLAAGLAFWGASWNSWLLLGVVAALATNWFGDSLDGTVARVRNQQRPRYGFYVDHVIDVAGALLLFGGMTASIYMSPVVGLSLLVAYMMVSAESYLATHARKVFKMSFLRIGPTELRLLMAAGALRVMVDPVVWLFGREFLLLDVGGVVATIGIGVAFVVSAARNTVALYREEPLPRAHRAEETKKKFDARHRMVSLDSLPLVTRPDLGQPQLAVSPRRSSRLSRQS
jgi:phosphatidylglycerophosphate synthase